MFKIIHTIVDDVEAVAMARFAVITLPTVF